MSDARLPTAAKRNLETIRRVQQHFRRPRAWAERLGEAVAQFFGSLTFVFAHAAAALGWIALNLGWLGIGPFDPYPFPLLGLIVGIEFILLTTFVLMNQKFQLRRQKANGELLLQLTILTEQEVTKNLQLLHLICELLGIREAAGDGEIKEMKDSTPVKALAKAIDKTHRRDAAANEQR